MHAYRFRREELRLPPGQLRHMEIYLSFHPDHVDGTNTLTLVTAEPMSVLMLDAQELEVSQVELLASRLPGEGAPAAVPPRAAAVPLTWTLRAAESKLRIELGAEVPAGTELVIRTTSRCVPSESRLEGLYYDVAPAGAPPQIMSQCQQWGFQRILPVIDDCTAKATLRTTLEADSRYTHLISNGDIDRRIHPDQRPVPKPGDPSRKVITYVNDVPMAPYLFIACVGTWEVLADEVMRPDGRTIRLEYLVPPGRLAGAAVPMAILKDAILWHQRTQDYIYPFDVYRTICMEKSDYGGMENVGNTTIITEAALIDEWTSDSRLIYAHGVIIHEFEHNQCGSDVTMLSPFDMWLNEAFTVDVERQYLQTVFDPAFLRLREVDAMRAPLTGPLAVEDAGHQGRIVRDGFNHPSELVDGLTYVKAAEVLRMLKLLLGEALFRQAKNLYFERHQGGNATTDEFLACFEEVSRHDLSAFKREWLHTIGYPAVTMRHFHEADARRLTVTVEQARRGAGGCFHFPLALAAVDDQGRDIPTTSGTFAITQQRHEFIFDDVRPPAFISANRDASFYGTLEDLTAPPEHLRRQVRLDPNTFNRVEAMRHLTDLERVALLEGRDSVSPDWAAVYRDLLVEPELPDGLKGYLLQIDEQPLDRRYLSRYADCYHARHTLLKAAARGAGADLFRVFAGVHTLERERTLGLSAAIQRRFLKGVLMELLVALDTPEAQAVLERHWQAAWNITDRLNALSAIYRSSHPDRLALLDEGRQLTQDHLPAYSAYLAIVGRSPHVDVFDCLEREERRNGFQLSHPGHARSLLVPMSLNNARLWTEKGLAWLTQTVIRLAPVNENTTLRILSCCQQVAAFDDRLQPKVVAALETMAARVPAETCPSTAGRLRQYLGERPGR